MANPLATNPPGSTGGGGGGGSWGWLVPIIGAVVGGIMDKASNDATNKANAQNVDKQLAFQKEQSATEWQRAVADIRAAGLNPALAYNKGGNSSGSGAAAEARGLSHSQRMAQAVEAYNQLSTGTAQRELIREQAAATDAQRIKTLAEANVMAPAAEVGQSGEYKKAYFDTAFREQWAKGFIASKSEEQYMANLGQTKQATATAKQQADLMRTQATLNEQEFMNEWFRKNVAPYLNSTAKAIEGVGAVARTGKGVTGLKPMSRYY